MTPPNSPDGKRTPKEFVSRECWMITLWDVHHSAEKFGEFFFDIQDIIKRLCVGSENCPETNRLHSHLVLQFKNPISFDSLRRLLDHWWGKGNYGGIRYNAKPHGFIKYARKNGDTFEWSEPKPEAKTYKSVVKTRDNIALVIIDMCKDEKITLQDIWKEFPVFTFWHRKNVLDCMWDHRAFRQGKVDGYSPEA